MTRLRSLNERNQAKSEYRDEEYAAATALMLIALYDLALEYLNGKIDEGLTRRDLEREVTEAS